MDKQQQSNDGNNNNSMNDSLSIMENKINRKIKELKDKMKKTSQRTETDRLWIRIETLQWALAQILAACSHISSTNGNLLSVDLSSSY